MNKDKIEIMLAGLEGIADALKEGVEKETTKEVGKLLEKRLKQLGELLKEKDGTI